MAGLVSEPNGKSTMQAEEMRGTRGPMGQVGTGSSAFHATVGIQNRPVNIVLAHKTEILSLFVLLLKFKCLLGTPVSKVPKTM